MDIKMCIENETLTGIDIGNYSCDGMCDTIIKGSIEVFMIHDENFNNLIIDRLLGVRIGDGEEIDKFFPYYSDTPLTIKLPYTN